MNTINLIEIDKEVNNNISNSLYINIKLVLLSEVSVKKMGD